MAEIPQVVGNIVRHPIRSTAVLALGVIGAAGVGYGPESFGADGPAPAGATELSISAGGDAHEAVTVTDTVLQNLDRNVYNCGGHLQPETKDGYSVDYAINYYNSNPDLAKPMIDFHNSTLGEEAVQSLINNGINNADTSATEHFTGESPVQAEVDTLLHKRSRVSLNAERVYANYSCITGSGEFNIHRASRKPTIAIDKDSHVEGIRVDDAGLLDFLTKVKKNADGQVPVDIIDLGQQLAAVNGKAVMQHESLVVLYADGCDNPILKLTVPKPGQPNKTPGTSTSTPTTIESKFDDGVLPGDGTPASQDHGTPDKAGKGPAGQTPGTDGYLPGETVPTVPATRPTPRPTTPPSTGTPPTTGTQPVAPPTPPTTGETPPDRTTTPTTPAV